MTQTPGVWQRVLARAALGLWQQRQTLLVGGVLVGAMLAYLTLMPSLSLGNAATQSNANDCADTVMAAVVGVGTPAIQQQAYQCMDPAIQQRVSQQEFSSQFQASQIADVTKVSRLGSYGTQTGAELVYYAVDAGQQSVGFVVYLSPTGKVTKID